MPESTLSPIRSPIPGDHGGRAGLRLVAPRVSERLTGKVKWLSRERGVLAGITGESLSFNPPDPATGELARGGLVSYERVPNMGEHMAGHVRALPE
jgi:hypothetical protein